MKSDTVKQRVVTILALLAIIFVSTTLCVLMHLNLALSQYRDDVQNGYYRYGGTTYYKYFDYLYEYDNENNKWDFSSIDNIGIFFGNVDYKNQDEYSIPSDKLEVPEITKEELSGKQ